MLELDLWVLEEKKARTDQDNIEFLCEEVRRCLAFIQFRVFVWIDSAGGRQTVSRTLDLITSPRACAGHVLSNPQCGDRVPGRPLLRPGVSRSKGVHPGGA